MSKQVRKALETLKENVKTNGHRVEKKLFRSGSRPNRAVVFAAAQYYPALRKLAKA